jgi:hypothetical protein
MSGRRLRLTWRSLAVFARMCSDSMRVRLVSDDAASR